MAGGDLTAATDYDLGARQDHAAGSGGLLADGAVAGDLYGQAGGCGLFNHLAHGEAEE